MLRGEALRNLARSMFSSFYEKGLSANQALRILREQGLGYRRQDFLRDYKEGLGDYRKASTIKYVNLNHVPSDDVFLPRYHGLPDKYGYLVKWQGYDNELNQIREGYAWFFTDYKGTRADIENLIATTYRLGRRYAMEWITVSLREGHINPYWEEF